ncbi:MAG: S8 family serine peptidase, partial [Flavobacteriaceae bacterium]|nr:S8 family serine peptidase [Flavobacteriaceae bacterium]
SKVILVASTQSAADASKHDQRSRFSNYGLGVDVAAPGNPILSTSKLGKYIAQSGTSMAAPNAAGAAALIWSVNPDWSRDQVLAKLMTSSDDIDALNPRYKHKLGNGRVNSFRALTEEVKAPSVRQAWYFKKNKLVNIHFLYVLIGLANRLFAQNP